MIKPRFLTKLLLSLVLLLLLLASNGYCATEFVCAINKTGEDYGTITSWEGVVDNAGDITASDVKVITINAETTAFIDGETATGATSGATGTVIHQSATQILIDAITGTFQAEQITGSTAGDITILDDADSPIIVAEVYDDDGDLGLYSFGPINGFTTNATNYVKVTASSGETPVFAMRAAWDGYDIVEINDNYIEISYLTLTYDSMSVAKVSANVITVYLAGGVNIHHNIINNTTESANLTGTLIGIKTEYHGGGTFHNNLIYDMNSATATVKGISLASNSYDSLIYNNTLYSIDDNGIESARASAGTIIKNNLVIDCGTDFTFEGTETHDYNASSDGTATGANSLNSGNGSPPTSSDFVSDTEDSENLHLAVGAVEINEGEDLGDIGAAVDIDGRNRHDEGDTWDIGADEYISVAATSNAQIIHVNMM